MSLDNTGKEYATKDIANMVGIAESTVRKYSQELENAGYQFTKNENGFRIFKEKDLFVFNEIKTMSNDKAMPVKRIAEMIVFNQTPRHKSEADTPIKIQQKSEETGDIVTYDSRYNALINKLDKLDMIDTILNELKQQKQFNQALLKRLDEQQNKMEQHIENRDRQLMSLLKENHQARIEQAATQQKKGFFAKLFKKD